MEKGQDKHVARAEKKLREACFFHGFLLEGGIRFYEHVLCRTITETEDFDFYLSAFLAAARSVLDVATDSHQFAAFYTKWGDENVADRDFLDSMKKMCDVEVHHHSGVPTKIGDVYIEIHDTYTDATGTYLVAAPPDTPPTFVTTKDILLKLPDDTTESVVSVCARLIETLSEVLRAYAAS